MVGAVKKWQMSDPEKARENWQKLSDANLELETKLNVLSKLAKDHWDVYLGVIKSCSVLTSEKVFFLSLSIDFIRYFTWRGSLVHLPLVSHV